MRVLRWYPWLYKTQWKLAEHLWLSIWCPPTHIAAARGWRYVLGLPGLQRHELNKALLLTKYLVIFSYTKRSYNALHEYFLSLEFIFCLLVYHCLLQQNKCSQASEMAQLGKCLLCRLENPISISRTHVKKNMGVVAHALCGGGDRPMLLGKAYVSERLYLQN